MVNLKGFLVPHSKYGWSRSSWVSKLVLNIKQARRRRRNFFTKYLKYPNFGVFNLFSLIENNSYNSSFQPSNMAFEQ